eukprot:365277-Chlamydomonas_euryale.AAC.2
MVPRVGPMVGQRQLQGCPELVSRRSCANPLGLPAQNIFTASSPSAYHLPTACLVMAGDHPASNMAGDHPASNMAGDHPPSNMAGDHPPSNMAWQRLQMR